MNIDMCQIKNYTNKTKEECYKFISYCYLTLTITFVLKMMMKWSHKKDSLSRPFKVYDLKYNGYA